MRQLLTIARKSSNDFLLSKMYANIQNYILEFQALELQNNRNNMHKEVPFTHLFIQSSLRADYTWSTVINAKPRTKKNTRSMSSKKWKQNERIKACSQIKYGI